MGRAREGKETNSICESGAGGIKQAGLQPECRKAGREINDYRIALLISM